jgi:hypothetical protein
MYIDRISSSASQLFIAIGIVIVLLTSTVSAGTLDDKTKKGESTTQSKPPKSKNASSGGSGKSSSSSGSSSSGAKSSGNVGNTHGSAGSGSSSNGGGTSTTDSGRKHNKTVSGDTNTTSTGSGANTRSGHKHDNNNGSTNASTSGSGHKEKKHAGEGGSPTTSTGSTAGATGESNTSHSGKHDKNRTTDATGGSTGGSAAGATTTSTSTKGKTKHDSTNPTGEGTSISGKGVTVNGASMHPGLVKSANGKPEVYHSRDGSEARFRRDGSVREVHTRGMTIIHRPGGSRTVIVERPDRSRIVVNRFGHGYVQRPFLYRNHEFYNRTYYYRGRPYALYYRGYPYRGVVLHGYVPYRYYNPAFYGWAYRPWYRPVRYNWGWFGSPWYGYYGRYYFTPYSAYPSASFWLTDFLIATSLQAAYEERLASQGSYYSSAPSGSVALTPEVKDAISNEVQRQLALENSESRIATNGDLDMNSSGLPRMLAEASPSNPRIFVVAGTLDVTDIQGQECLLTEGDVLRLSSPPGTNESSANLEVLATKNQSCPKGTTVSVGFADLQEMQNHMRATIDRGLQDLQEHQGGLPAPPPGATTAPVQASFAPIAPPPDPNVTSELQSQALEADAADRQILTEVNQADNSSTSGTSAEPAEISLGQTTREVEAILGKPRQVVNLGSKKMYVYPSMKITFIDGKVSDVE